MSVVSAPTRAGRSPYHSEPSIEAPNPTTSVRSRNPKPAYPRAIRPRAGVQPDTAACSRTTARTACRPRPGSRCRSGDAHPAAVPGIRRPASPPAVRATYPSPRADPCPGLDYVAANPCKLVRLVPLRVCDVADLIQSRATQSLLWERAANRTVSLVSTRRPNPKWKAPNPKWTPRSASTPKVDPVRVVAN
jgi:hypothetical protein